MNRFAQQLSIAVLLVLFVAGGALASSMDPPAQLYTSTCANCHGPNGDGRTAYGVRNKVPDFRTKAFQDKSDEAIYASIATGAGHVVYPHSFASRGMDREKITGLVGYLRTFKAAK